MAETGTDVARINGLVSAFEAGPHCLVVETDEGREIRITARRDLSTGRYHPYYERLTLVMSKGVPYNVWAHTPAYQVFASDDPDACLQQAAEEVARLRIY